MRVTLVIPPSSFLLDERVFPSLGVLKVAATLREAGVDVDVLDLSGVPPDAVAAHVTRHNDRARRIAEPVAAFGLTATMPQMPSAVAIAQQLSMEAPSARLILGGPHPTLLNSSARLELQRGVYGRARRALDELLERFDVVVAGDGEKTIGLALAQDPPPLIDADDPSSTLFLTKADLNAQPLPARDLIDIASYRYEIDGVKTQSMIAQLGCPYGCNFCGGRRSPFLRRVRMRETANVIAEMDHLYTRYGTRGFMFLDDELNVNPAFMGLLDQIVALQSRLGVEFRLRGLVKSELVTDAMAAAMYRAGFRQLLIGFESGDDRILLNMNKHATLADNTRCVETLRRNGIRVKALMSFGHPGETAESTAATRDWLLRVRPDDFDVTIITVYPGTPYYDDAVENGDGTYTYTAKNGDRLHALQVDHLTDVNFYKGMVGAYQSFVWTDELSRESLCARRDAVESEVRAALGIPWPRSASEVQFEHSMGAR